MKDNSNTNAGLWVLLLTFGGLLILFIIYATQYSKGRRESGESYAQYREVSSALGTVYRKLLTGKTNLTGTAGELIRPEDVRSALANGTNELGELPAWISGDVVYVANTNVSLGSGKFICFVLMGKK